VTAASKWVCPRNPTWCENTGCQGDECGGGYTQQIPALLDPELGTPTDSGVEFPAVSTGRYMLDGVPGVCVTLTSSGGEWRGFESASVYLLRRDAEKLVADLTGQLRLLDDGRGRDGD